MAIDRIRHHFLQNLHTARMWMRSLGGPMRAGTARYRRGLREEVEHYSKVHGESKNLFEPAPAVWDLVLDKASARIESRLGAGWLDYAAWRLEKADARMLSLGCGAGGVELAIAAKAPQAEYVCLDLNGDLFARAREGADGAGAKRMEFIATDLNSDPYDRGRFDVVLCHASLHHLVELEHVMEGIARSLAPEGELLVIDVNTPNGFRMAEATRKAAATVFATLPERFRWNHVGYGEVWLDDKIFQPPAMMEGMECQRSADVLPLLRKHFQEALFVPYFGLCRRFFDTMYGPNYHLDQPLDRAIVEWIWELDCDSVDRGALPPESFFGVYRLKPR
ncbi:MAG: class I SAM-dependent methyltransferase [Bryobacteraceae bacterium]